VPRIPGARDGFDYLAGKRVSEINRLAYQATAKAHSDGGVPNMTLQLPGRTPRALGEFFYVCLRAIAMTGFLFGVNPFDEPGVNDYKRVMYQLLGRPEAGVWREAAPRRRST
jgi:glucose-6-phosphate isomerase